MSRAALWGALSGITPVEATLISAYENEEAQIWREGSGKNPHGQKWSQSFHASSFPGDDPAVCGRMQVYKLMDPFQAKPHEPKTRMLFDLGTAIEHMFVKRWSNYGVLLSADVTGDDQYQTNFEDPECWLTGSPDAIILPPFHTKAHVLDVKTTSHEKVNTMRDNPEATIYSHKKYIRQLRAYIAEANDKFSPTVITCAVSGLLIKNGRDKCPAYHGGKCRPKIIQVEPPDDGTLFYASREEPITCTASYYVYHDPKIIEAGKARLKEWREYFERDEIPPHVREGESSKWTIGDCQYCELKKSICKIDYKEKTKKLSESALVEFNRKFNSDYDPIQARQEVLNRWPT